MAKSALKLVSTSALGKPGKLNNAAANGRHAGRNAGSNAHRDSGSDSARDAGRTNATEKIVDSITDAIVEHRLMPGTKLPEQKIATIFGVSRTIVRQALNQLSVDRLVALEASRGAFVAMPSVEEARDVFQVRVMIESTLISQLAREITKRQISELRAHLREEDRAVSQTDVAGRTRLLGDFHVVLARLSGNAVLESLLTDLVSRSALISLMYQSSHSAVHSSDEHVLIVDALEAKDEKQAARLMRKHLTNVERGLLIEPRNPDLESVLIP